MIVSDASDDPVSQQTPPVATRGSTTATLIVGDERLGHIKSEVRQQCPRGTKVATTVGCTLKQAYTWIMSEDNLPHIPSDKFYIFCGLWDIIKINNDASITTYSDSGDSAEETKDRIIAGVKSLITSIEQNFTGRSVIMLTNFGLCVEKYNMKNNLVSTEASSNKLQELIDNTILLLNREFVKLNKQRGWVSPRYDRNMYRYDCKRKKWRVVGGVLDDSNPTLPSEEYKKVIIEKIATAVEANKRGTV